MRLVKSSQNTNNLVNFLGKMGKKGNDDMIIDFKPLYAIRRNIIMESAKLVQSGRLKGGKG